MKDFIQNRLRLMLEGFVGKMDEGVSHSSKEDLEKLRHTLVYYQQEYGDDPYFMADGEGDAPLRVSVNQHGVVATVSTAKASASIVKTNISQVGETKDYKIYQLKAGRGIEHPGTYKDRDHSAVTRKNGVVEYETRSAVSPEGELVKYKVAKPGSPASDAVIKVFMIHGIDIGNFVKKNMKGYDAYVNADDSAAEIAAAKNSPELADKVQAKKDKYDRAVSKPKQLAPDVKILIRQKEELVNKLQSLKGNDKSVRVEAKKVRDEIKFLDDKIRELNYAGSSKDDYLRSKKGN